MEAITARQQLVQPWLTARATIAQELMLEVAEDTFQCQDTPPKTPSALKASALGGGRVRLRWDGVVEQPARFVIQRWTAANGWSDIAYVPGYRTSFVDQDLTPYTTCACRVLAEGASGRSTPSNVARVSVR